jgi:hypothetical protein
MSQGGRSPSMTIPVNSLSRSTLGCTKSICMACSAKHLADAPLPTAGCGPWAHGAAGVQSRGTSGAAAAAGVRHVHTAGELSCHGVPEQPAALTCCCFGPSAAAAAAGPGAVAGDLAQRFQHPPGPVSHCHSERGHFCATCCTLPIAALEGGGPGAPAAGRDAGAVRGAVHAQGQRRQGAADATLQRRNRRRRQATALGPHFLQRPVLRLCQHRRLRVAAHGVVRHQPKIAEGGAVARSMLFFTSGMVL